MQQLPIDDRIADIVAAVRNNPITIVEAPPGSGKTTRVAPALMDALGGATGASKLYLLQPRRLAARSVAERIAYEQGSGIGEKIGYQVRFDHQVSSQTQLIVATEGILLRRLQQDPGIDDVGIVLLDEFHERSLDADLLLAMLRRVQESLREDLKIVIMSATIDTELMTKALGDVPVIQVESRCFPVTVQYKPMNPRDRMNDHVVKTVRESFEKLDGDILVFLPGAGEIHRVQEELMRSGMERDADIHRLYGAMPLEEQARVIAPSQRRKIVLSTNVAETSLTIEGVRIVVDSGQARVMRFVPDVGLDRLELENISQASATQRAGRAGRVAPGICVRLWSEAADRARAPYLEPEIRRLDLASAVLQLYFWGEGNSPDFPWLEAPRPDAWDAAVRLLENLGALQEHRITNIGKRMAQLPIHPRLARMVIDAGDRGCLSRVALLAAMLAERDPFVKNNRGGFKGGIHTKSAPRWDSDCLERLIVIENYLNRNHGEQNPFGELHLGSVRSIVSSAEQIIAQAKQVYSGDVGDLDSYADDNDSVLQSLLAGFPDRLARRRSTGKPNGLMVGGKGVTLGHDSGVRDAEFFLCIDIDAGRGADATVRQASKVEVDWILTGLKSSEELFFHPTQKQVVARRQTRWIDLVLQETPTSISDSDRASELLFQAVKQNWDAVFPSGDDAFISFVERVNCLREWLPELELPTVDRLLLEKVAEQLCAGKRSLAEVKAGAWTDWLRSHFTSDQLQTIDKEAPSRIVVPSGNSIRLEYKQGAAPILAVKIQEVFSMKTTPRIARGTVPVLMHLLSPAMRPQQVTNDLASFWANGYPEIKKELKRRYPKHNWPDDPTTATPGRK